MTGPRQGTRIAAGRLDAQTLQRNFSDIHPALDDHEALVAADRCYFCYDAPCVTACPTQIDIPLFIRQISTGMPEQAAKTIFDQNILGGMCARVCPTETLCEQACVREAAEGKPVNIGLLQRFATDKVMAEGTHPFARAASTGKKIAVVGAGPAGLACAHRLAMHGHDVVIYEARPKGGGLNEYGIAAYKTVDGFAQAELDWLMQIGGIEIAYDTPLGSGVTLAQLQADHDAVFLGMGLGGVRAAGFGEDDIPAARAAVDFIAELRQSDDLAKLKIGERVLVIGGGMTAIDAATQAQLLGAGDVTIAYRRGRADMGASDYEKDVATTRGVRLRTNLAPTGFEQTDDGVAVSLARTQAKDGSLTVTKDVETEVFDQVFLAIGQTLDADGMTLELTGSKIAVDAHGASSAPGVWAGGDCASGGDDLTVTAVAEGRDAAEAIHEALVS